MKFEFFADAVSEPPKRPAHPSVGYPSNGDPLTGRPPTTPGAWFYYMLMVEFETLLSQNGIVPSAENLHQLADFFSSYKQAMTGIETRTKTAITTVENGIKAVNQALADTQASAEIAKGINFPRAAEVTILAADVQQLSAELEFSKLKTATLQAQLDKITAIVIPPEPEPVLSEGGWEAHHG